MPYKYPTSIGLDQKTKKKLNNWRGNHESYAELLKELINYWIEGHKTPEKQLKN